MLSQVDTDLFALFLDVCVKVKIEPSDAVSSVMELNTEVSCWCSVDELSSVPRRELRALAWPSVLV